MTERHNPSLITVPWSLFSLTIILIVCTCLWSQGETAAEPAEETVSAEETVPAEEAPAETDATEAFIPLPDGPTVVTPPDQSVMMGSHIGLIVRGQYDELYLDDEEYPWSKRIRSNIVSYSLLKVSPGRHVLYMCSDDGREEEIRFVVAMNDRDHSGPRSWTRSFQHQFENISNPCQKCHLTRKVDGDSGSTVEVGHWKTERKACWNCHVEQKRNKLIEFHKTVEDQDWMEKCISCHYVHQGKTRILLKETPEP